MQTIHDLLIFLNQYLWGPPMLVLLVGTLNRVMIVGYIDAKSSSPTSSW